MEIDDRITIATPEGVELELQLAGLASRFIAGLADLTIQLALIAALALATGGILGTDGLDTVVFVIGAFAIWFVYPIAFEVGWRGRTPGKAVSQLRVLRDTGSPIDLPASAIRNLMRLLDGPTLGYLPTVISIAVTARNQRPGDLAAGTLVIREAAEPRRTPATGGGGAGEAGLYPVDEQGAWTWDVSAVSQQELMAVRHFLDRRAGLEREARRRLAARLAEGLRGKVAGADDRANPEQFLERLAQVKGRRG